MNQNGNFWSQNSHAMQQKKRWFGKMPPLQKICYSLLLLFAISWCFYLGMTYAFAIAPEKAFDIKDGSEWIMQMQEETGDTVVRLHGVEVTLLVGADKRFGETRYRTDTIIMAFYNWDTDELKLLSIPRDSYVQFPGKSTKTKINEAYFYGGMPLLESVIEYTFGLKINHWVEIDFAGFLQMINALKGVEIDVPQRMYKPTEEINLKPGLQVLNGYDALAFVRFRDLPMGDIDRIVNQQTFIRALTAKISGSSVFKAPQLVNIGLEHTSSNYTLPEALLLGTALYRTDLLNIPMYSLPGNGLYIGNGNYWILNEKGVVEIITEITGGELGDFHIIGDGGRGATKPPAPAEKEQEAATETTTTETAGDNLIEDELNIAEDILPAEEGEPDTGQNKETLEESPSQPIEQPQEQPKIQPEVEPPKQPEQEMKTDQPNVQIVTTPIPEPEDDNR
ncbi:MAG: LCP family protein [Firmicutes bacterium]|nr:LCP family protein [Bacillota bacterium]